jgi:hypothetical protein
MNSKSTETVFAGVCTYGSPEGAKYEHLIPGEAFGENVE